jgi:hypothetical protein
MNQLSLPSPIIDTIDNLNAAILTFSPEFAKNNLTSVIEFLKQYNGNQATFDAYRREVERLLQWSWLVAKKSILELARQDIQEYIEFCLNPPIAWMGTTRVSRFVERGGIRQANPRWRPFVATVSKQDYKTGKNPTKTNTAFHKKLFKKFLPCSVAFIIFCYSKRKYHSIQLP